MTKSLLAASKRALAVGALASMLLVAAGAAQAVECARPTDAQGSSGYDYASATVESFGSERVLVWYTTAGPHAVSPSSTRADGVPDDVASVAEVTTSALDRYEAMGFRTPLADDLNAECGSNGGDARLDVYLVAMNGADGMAVPEAGRCSSPHRCASFLIAKSNYALTYGSADIGIRTVLPHELFHAVQNAYDTELDRFWAEGTAQWATKVLHPDLADLERNLPAFFRQPSRSLDAPPSGVTAGFLYGAAIWPVFLSERFDDDIVRRILEQEAEVEGTAIAATDAVLRELGSSMQSEFPQFAAWNAGTGSRRGTGGYALAADYPEVPVSELTNDGAQGISSGLASFYFTVRTDRALRFSLTTDASRNAGRLVPFENGAARLDRLRPLPAELDGEGMIVVSGITTSKTDAPFTLDITSPSASAPPESGGCAVARAASSRAPFALLALVGMGLSRWRIRQARSRRAGVYSAQSAK